MKRAFLSLTFLLPGLIFSVPRWDGDYYKENSQMQYGVAALILKQFSIPQNAAILDIGSGDGRVSEYLTTFVPNGYVIGVDKSESMIKTAAIHTNPNLSFIQAEASAIPFKDQFDVAVSFNCLHWVPDINAALTSIKEALKKGGKTLFLLAPVQPRSPCHKIIETIAYSKKWQPFFGSSKLFNLYSLAEWGLFIEKAGLIAEKLEFVDASSYYPNKETFAAWLTGWLPFGTMPQKEKDIFVEEIIEAYLKAVPSDKNGGIHFQLEELVIVASKPNL